MHRCFAIPEIVSIICENISDLPDIGGLSCELADLAAFARTCRAVHEQALDRLWHTQTSIIPLLRCMPDDVWENYREDEDDGDVDSKPRFIVYPRRVILPSDWSRPKKYYYRVKCFGVEASYDDNEILSLEGFRAVENSTPFIPIFPSLIHFSWLVYYPICTGAGIDEDLFPYMRLFIGPPIRSIELAARYLDTANQSLLFKLVPIKETLETLRLCGSLEDFEIQGVLEKIVPDLRTLTEYVCDGIGPPSKGHVTALSRLPALRVLTLNADCGHRSVSPWHLPQILTVTNDVTPFVALRELSLQDCSLSSLTSLLGSLQNSRLASISLSSPWVPDFENYPEHLAAFLSTLAKSCSQLLHSLSIGNHHFPGDLDIPNALPAAQIRDIIQKILPFRKLKVIRINLPYLFTIEDSLIDKLPEAWPELAWLDISPQNSVARRPNPPPLATLAGLVALTRFPKLHMACLNVDAREMKYSTIKGKFNIPTSNINHLNLDHSLLDDPVDFAQCLTECFPNLEKLDLWSEEEECPKVIGYTAEDVLRYRTMVDEVKRLIIDPPDESRAIS